MLNKWDCYFRECVNRCSIMLQTVTNYTSIYVCCFMCPIISAVLHASSKWMKGALAVISVAPMYCILYQETVVLSEIQKHYTFIKCQVLLPVAQSFCFDVLLFNDGLLMCIFFFNHCFSHIKQSYLVFG